MGFAVNRSDVSEIMTPTEMIVSVGVFAVTITYLKIGFLCFIVIPEL